MWYNRGVEAMRKKPVVLVSQSAIMNSGPAALESALPRHQRRAFKPVGFSVGGVMKRDSGGPCEYCGRNVNRNGALALHQKYCKENPDREQRIPWNKGLTKEDDDRVAAYAKKLEGIPVSDEVREKIRQTSKGREPWNKGLTRDEDDRIPEPWNKGLTAEDDERVAHCGTKKGAIFSEEHKRKLSESMQGRDSWAKGKTAETDPRISWAGENHGFYGKKPPKGAGRGNGGYYKECWMRSSWEIAFAKWCDGCGIEWQHEPKRFFYRWQGSERYWWPDFYLVQRGIFIEIKGYATKRDRAKWESFPEMLYVMQEGELQYLGVLS